MTEDRNEVTGKKQLMALMQRYNISPRKQWGQNFLADAHVLEKIASAAELSPEDTVVEIGPGLGSLTQVLAREAGQVIAVEIDPRLTTVLQDLFQHQPHVKIMQGDILKLNLKDLLPDGSPKAKVVANLPYYITTPILMHILETEQPVKTMTVMMQKEVAERIRAIPGSKDYGALSLAVQYYARVYYAANVPPNCFIPRPGVESAVLHLTLHDQPPVSVKNREFLFQVIRAGFSKRRKTLANCLESGLSLKKDLLFPVFRDCGLSEQVRGETLSLADYACLADALWPFTENKDE